MQFDRNLPRMLYEELIRLTAKTFLRLLRSAGRPKSKLGADMIFLWRSFFSPVRVLRS